MADQTEKKILIDVKVETAQAIKNMADAQISIKALRDTNKELSKSYDQNAEAIAANQIKIKNLQATVSENQKVALSNTATVNGSEGAYKKLSLQYSVAAQKAKDMAAAYGTNSAQSKQASADALKMSDKLKEIDSAVGQNQRNVGNYGGALGKMQSAMEVIPKSASDMGKGLGSLISPMKAVIVQMWAMVANPIGAAIAAVALVLGGLYLVFKDFKPIVDKVEQALAALGAVFATVKNVITGLLTGQKSLKESTEGLGKAMGDAASAAMKLKKAQQELEDSQAGLEEQNKRDETLIQKLMLQSRNRTLAEKDRIKILEQAQRASDDIYKRNKKQNDDEVKNAEEAIRIKMGLSRSEMKQLRLIGSAYAEKMQDQKGTAKDEIATLSAALLKREDIRQQDIAIQEKAQTRIDTLADAAQAREEKRIEKNKADKEKAIEAALKRQEAGQKKELANDERLINQKKKIYDGQTDSTLIDPSVYDERLKQSEDIYKQDIVLAEKRAKFDKTSEEDLLTFKDGLAQENLNRQKDLLSKRTDLLIENLQRQSEMERLVNDESTAGVVKSLADQRKAVLFSLEIDRLEKEASLKLELDGGKILQDKYNKEIELLNQQTKTSIALTNADFDKKDADQKISNAQKANDDSLAAVRNNINLEFALKLKGIELLRDAELKAAIESGADITKINAKFDQQILDNKLEKFQAEFEAKKKWADAGLNIASAGNDLLKSLDDARLQKAEEANAAELASLQSRLDNGLISQQTYDASVAASNEALDKKKRKMAHDEAVRSKILNAFKIVIDTASAVVAMLKSGPIGIPLAIAAGITGAASLAATLEAPVPKAAKGMLLKGKTHAQGGIKIEAEHGESVINARSTSMFKPLLSAINEAGGGVKFANGGIPSSGLRYDGGYEIRSISNNTQQGITASQMKDVMAQMKIYTTITDIRREDQKFTTVKDRATI